MSDEKKPPEPEPKPGQGSEVKRLLEIIRLEYEAAQRGLTGLAYGTSQHDFITKRIEGIEAAREHLVNVVGDEDEANELVIKQLIKQGEEPKKPKGETSSDKP